VHYDEREAVVTFVRLRAATGQKLINVTTKACYPSSVRQ
jgi:hypothetical protein